MSFKQHLAVYTACMVLSLLLGATDASATTVSVNWQIVRHVDASFSATHMDALLKDGNSRIELFDYRCSGNPDDEDIPCALTLQRNGSISTFGMSGDGRNIINSAVDLDAVMDANPGKVIVVDQVNFCEQYSPSIIGCGDFPGNTFVVEKDVEIDTFIHEYGHNRGLDHRRTCDKAFMNDLTSILDALTESECVAMGGKKFKEVSSSVGGTLVAAQEPFWAHTNIVVPQGQTLVIEPNVTIQFNRGVSIRGRVTADGRSGPIRLYSNCSSTHPCPRVYPVIP